MYSTLQYISFMALGFVQLAAQCVIILLLFKKPIRLKEILLFSLVVDIFHQVPAIILPYEMLYLNIIIYFATLFLALLFILKFNILSSFVAIGLMYIFTSIMEYVGMAILQISFQDNFIIPEWAKSYPKMLIARGLGTVLCIIVAIIIYYSKMKINFPEDFNKKRSLSVVIAILVSVFIIIPNILFYINGGARVDYKFFLFNAISLLILLIFTTYSTVKFGELNVKSQQIEYQNLSIKSLKETIDGLRSFKHDLNNIMQVFKMYLDMGNIEGANNYFNQVFGELRIINNAVPLEEYLKDNPAVYGLVLAKMGYAEAKDLIFNINITSEVDIKGVKTLDFCKVLGILLDNAMEAAAESKKKTVELNIFKDVKENQVVIEIINSFKGDVDAKEIFINGFTTKTGHTGFGLYEVRKIIGKYSHCSLNTNISGSFFTQKICI